MRNQLPLDGIVVHVSQFLISFAGTPRIQIVEAPLPNAEMRVIMDRGGQGHARKHVLAPGCMPIVLQISEDELCSPFFQAANDLRGVRPFRGPDQKMKMFGHQYVADDPEFEFDPQAIER